MPRLYREAPVNAIWEGSGNVQALDLLRVLERNPTAYDAWRSEIAGVDGRLAEALANVDALVRAPTAVAARELSVRMAVLSQAALLVQHSPTPVSDAFCRSRLPVPQAMWGMPPQHVDERAIIVRTAVRQH